MGDIELPDDDPWYSVGANFVLIVTNCMATEQYSWNADGQNLVTATITIRVTVSYDCPVYDCPDFDCVSKTCNQGIAAPYFLAHVYCRQTAGWINICHLVWTMEVRVGPDHIVLDGNPAPP